MPRVAGIKIEKTVRGLPRIIRIDLKKHADIIPYLQEKGLIEEPEIKLTAKMKKSIKEAENGESEVVDMDNFWNV